MLVLLRQSMRRRGSIWLVVVVVALVAVRVAATADGASGPVMVRTPFWASLIAGGSVSVGDDLNFATGRNRIDTQYGKVLTRIVPQDGLEQLMASGGSVVWVLSHLFDNTGPGAYEDQVVLASLSGKPHLHVLASCVETGAVAAIDGSTLVYGCNGVIPRNAVVPVPVRFVHVMNLAGGAKSVLGADGAVLSIQISGHYVAAAINTMATPYVGDGASEEIEVFDLRSMTVVGRVRTTAWIQSFGVSTSGAVALTEDASFQSSLQNPPPSEAGYGGQGCQRSEPLFVVPIGGVARMFDPNACAGPVEGAGARFVYPRIEGSGAALVSSGPTGRRIVLRRLGRAHGLLMLYAVATSARTVLYTVGTCRYSGGDLGVSTFAQPVATPGPLAPVGALGCPARGRLPAHVTLPLSQPMRAFHVRVGCPRGCSNAVVTLNLPGRDGPGAGGGTAAGVAPGGRVLVSVRCDIGCEGRHPAKSLIATLATPDRTGILITYATRTIHVSYCNAAQAACREKLTP